MPEIASGGHLEDDLTLDRVDIPLRLGSEGSTKVQQQLEDLRKMGVVKEEAFKQLKAIILAGHDGAHPHLPKVSAERAAVLLELAKDALYQLFVRKAKIEESVLLRNAAVKDQQQDNDSP